METFGQAFRRGQETRAEQTVNKFGEEPFRPSPLSPRQFPPMPFPVARLESAPAETADGIGMQGGTR